MVRLSEDMIWRACLWDDWKPSPFSGSHLRLFLEPSIPVYIFVFIWGDPRMELKQQYAVASPELTGSINSSRSWLPGLNWAPSTRPLLPLCHLPAQATRLSHIGLPTHRHWPAARFPCSRTEGTGSSPPVLWVACRQMSHAWLAGADSGCWRFPWVNAPTVADFIRLPAVGSSEGSWAQRSRSTPPPNPHPPTRRLQVHRS